MLNTFYTNTFFHLYKFCYALPPVGVANDSNDVINYAKHTIDFSLIVAIYMFGTNSICYQRPKAGYET